MAFQGHICEFNPSSDSWSDYIERLEEYFMANDIALEDVTKRRAILLSACGTETCSLIKKKPGGSGIAKGENL